MFVFPIIDPTAKKPLYLQLYNAIRNSILSLEMIPDEKLPSKRNLAHSLNVSVKTVENAYEQLILEGFLYTIEKKGVYVSPYKYNYENTKKNPVFPESRFYETFYRVNLRSNQNAVNDFPSNIWRRLMRETLAEDDKKLFSTVPFSGVYELRCEIANHLKLSRGMKVSPDQIIIGAGTEYLYSRLIQILGPNSIYGLANPSSKRLHELYTNNRLVYRAIPCDQNGPDISQLKNSDCQIFHVSPAHQYPLDSPIPLKNRIKLLEWADTCDDRFIIEDDYDNEYVISGHPIPPLFSIDFHENIIYMNTFSKSVSPAMRISYMILPSKLMPKYLATMSFYSCSVASVEQYTLAKFIKKGHLDRYIRRINKKNQSILKYFLAKLQSLLDNGSAKILSRNMGTHILLWVNTELDDITFKQRIREDSIIVSMMSEYYVDELEKYQHIMVINFSGLTEMHIEYFVSKLEKLMYFN